MFKTLLVITVVALAIFGSSSVLSTYVEVENCSDRAFCQPKSCRTSNVAASVCQPNTTTHTSGAIVCDPELRAAGILFSYSDPSCSSLIASQAFQCDQCDFHKDQKASCVSKNGVESLLIQKCESGCGGKCDTLWNVPVGTCVPNTDKQTGKITSYMQFEGARLATFVDVLHWEKNEECQGTPDAAKSQMLAQDSCIAGTVVKCHYDNSTNSEIFKIQREKLLSKIVRP